jgi:hypothetical protein
LKRRMGRKRGRAEGEEGGREERGRREREGGGCEGGDEIVDLEEGGP